MTYKPWPRSLGWAMGISFVVFGAVEVVLDPHDAAQAVLGGSQVVLGLIYLVLVIRRAGHFK